MAQNFKLCRPVLKCLRGMQENCAVAAPQVRDGRHASNRCDPAFPTSLHSMSCAVQYSGQLATPSPHPLVASDNQAGWTIKSMLRQDCGIRDQLLAYSSFRPAASAVAHSGQRKLSCLPEWLCSHPPPPIKPAVFMQTTFSGSSRLPGKVEVDQILVICRKSVPQ